MCSNNEMPSANSIEDINDFVPSILNPRHVRKQDLFLTQDSFVSRCSLSLKRGNVLTPHNGVIQDVPTVKNTMQHSSKNRVVLVSKENHPNNISGSKQRIDLDSLAFSAIEDFQTNNEFSPYSFGGFEMNDNLENLNKKGTEENYDKKQGSFITISSATTLGKEEANSESTVLIESIINVSFGENHPNNISESKQRTYLDSLDFSVIKDFLTNNESSPYSFGEFEMNDKLEKVNKKGTEENYDKKQESFITISSATALDKEKANSEVTVLIEPIINVSFGVDNCESIEVSARNGAIKRFLITHHNNSSNVDCEVFQTSQISEISEMDLDETSSKPLKNSAVAVSLEIKKQKLSENDRIEDAKVLILNTNAIEKISHVIVQPPNYRFVKRNLNRNKFKSTKSNKSVDDGKFKAGLKQISIDSFFRQAHATVESIEPDKFEDAEEMSRNSGVFDTVKCERVTRSAKAFRRESNDSPKLTKQPAKREAFSPRRDVKTSNSEAQSPRVGSSNSPRKNVESIHFSLPTTKSKSIRSSLSPRNIPHHKIVAGTHFAVDAFSYGDIPNVKHYFLTHFHSDHYSGLKKSFNKLLFCSKITADLCISRLGVNPKFIHVVNIDETLSVDGVEVTAVDANHCPGALMLVFTLPNGKTLLHTGDFRACPPMESYPVFWNRDIHTIYLDTTYCNPRYDFPTQDQSLEMAVYLLRQKKMVLEKAGKKFTSVLIVCGTYTIGKEKFFLGMSRRVGCSVWACPEKERVLQTVEGKSCSRDAPQACQLHVVPMRDLTHEKLRSYLDSLQGAFSEVVAFKPSGWENGKNSSVEKDNVTIHGIPYSEHSSFSELIRFVKFLKPKQVVPTVDISGGVKAVQKYFPCPLVYKDEILCQNKMTDYFSIQSRQQAAAVT